VEKKNVVDEKNNKKIKSVNEIIKKDEIVKEKSVKKEKVDVENKINVLNDKKRIKYEYKVCNVKNKKEVDDSDLEEIKKIKMLK
jgi:hypothetical protein